MDYKKLIGTIIGVTLFAILIAGATFAWLTFGTTLNEAGITTSNSMNFLVDYNNGDGNDGDDTNNNAITNIPMVDSTLVTPSQAAKTVVVMKKHSNSVDGHGYITLNTTSSDILTTGGVVRWAICRDTTIEGTGIAAEQVDSVCGSVTDTAGFSTKALNTGKITASGEIILLNDAKLTSTKCTINVATATTCTALQATGGSSTYQALLPTASATETASILIPPTSGVTVSGSKVGASSSAGVSYFIYFWLDGETINNNHKEKTYSGYVGAGANQYVE